MLKSGIYKITCLTNYRIYIGSSSNIKGRWINHLKRLRDGSHNFKFQNSFDKYKEENFLFEVIEYCEKERLIEREQFYLNTLLFASENDNRFNELSLNIRRVADSSLGIKRSDKQKSNMKHYNRTAILCYSLDGNLLYIFKNLTVACNTLKLKGNAGIYQCLKNKTLKHSNLMFRVFDNNHVFSKIDPYTYPLKNKSKPIQHTLNAQAAKRINRLKRLESTKQKNVKL